MPLILEDADRFRQGDVWTSPQGADYRVQEVGRSGDGEVAVLEELRNGRFLSNYVMRIATDTGRDGAAWRRKVANDQAGRRKRGRMEIEFMAISGALEWEAEMFAERRHGAINQRMKYTDEPYMAHLRAVVLELETVEHTPYMKAATWLHDTIEDTGTRIEEILSDFGIEVCALVSEVTNVSKPEDGNRAARKAKDLAHLKKATARGQTLKVCDVLVNTRTLVDLDPAFAAIRLPECLELVTALVKADPVLRARALKQINAGLDRLARLAQNSTVA
ncbi:HD domain-containing protein [Hydrogenophaga sp. 2FB]|uniref:HD domain-containing protein n=1 Tax=Hydrogenophaga sp. 2FB TaxID=2502187 RepID=UPI001BB15B3E|nr:HD domain-containing protein [Hydrogenophaga sp. 2FB]